jgi:cyclic pyranopterin phosphate synthase
MSNKIIPIIPASKVSTINIAEITHDMKSGVGLYQNLDKLNRPLTDLRISVTDRCNFRCSYCMPKEIFDQNYVYSPQKELLSFEEIIRLSKSFISLGVNKIRLTGGEPLLRKNIEDLIFMLSQLRDVNGNPIDLSLTTNGSLLKRKAKSLKEAGLNRITVSLDAINDTIFRQMNDVDFPVLDVLEGIEEAQKVGFQNIKINMVTKAGVNDQEILSMVNYFKNTPHVLRFIEYMDVGSSNQWKLDDVISSASILKNLSENGHHFKPLEARQKSETAERWQHVDGQGEIGFISSVSKAFCQHCSRARLSTQGMLYTCLFASEGHDLRSLIRNPNTAYSDQNITNAIAHIWHQREDRYSELRSQQLDSTIERTKKIEMSYIGG